jgi:hypothetical protein
MNFSDNYAALLHDLNTVIMVAPAHKVSVRNRSHSNTDSWFDWGMRKFRGESERRTLDFVRDLCRRVAFAIEDKATSAPMRALLLLKVAELWDGIDRLSETYKNDNKGLTAQNLRDSKALLAMHIPVPQLAKDHPAAVSQLAVEVAADRPAVSKLAKDHPAVSQLAVEVAADRQAVSQLATDPQRLAEIDHQPEGDQAPPTTHLNADIL